MKQHITLEQLKEVDSQVIADKLIKTRLIELKGDKLIRTKNFAKKINIGKMIEILSNISAGYNLIISGSEYNSYNVILNFFDISGCSESNIFSTDKDILVDTLWETVKYVLEYILVEKDA